jgi:hypothetical protein
MVYGKIEKAGVGEEPAPFLPFENPDEGWPIRLVGVKATGSSCLAVISSPLFESNTHP